MILSPRISQSIAHEESLCSVEEFVIDDREQLSPAELVQQKLQTLLPSRLIPVSALHMERVVNRFNGRSRN
ncbi:hypothetical protein KIH39_13815 [Telmatocola sphagniphila]|uniref:Uncharacterized protein n=1 Tax=Telmatocola sphagniphila TaxID=1123043 RepID=A0A8E6B2M7_9BACT|nr:hypothetical protein [Telmatocola sphagniphila]QVL29946.1 hypothetical protein KIH39_13815 [Telmatocola sphagniphila]